jgi:dTDP-glucose pyrophosphorylase
MINIVVPMAGLSSRFYKKGYKTPKFLIEIFGSLVIQKVIWSLGIDGTYIYLVQAKDNKKYNLTELLTKITPNSNVKIVEVDAPTEGAAVTTLLAKDHINNNVPLIICNSDQIIEWSPDDFFRSIQETKNLDGCILTFNSLDLKWSYVKTNSNGVAVEVAEKNPISDQATVGVYYWKRGKDYVKYAETMIKKDIRVNNEFYVCPVYNEAILNNKKITTYAVDKMIGLGTPEDLEEYVRSQSNSA